MQRRAMVVVASCLAVLGPLLASCAPAAPTPTSKTAPPAKAPVAESPAPKPAIPTPTPRPVAEQPRYGGILARAILEEPANLDIHRSVGASLLGSMAPVYSGLLQYDPLQNDKIVPDLAERWEVSPDRREHTFYLRKDVKWHDGKLFTSGDAKFSLERISEFSSLMIYVQGMSGIQKIETPSENVLKITSHQAEPALVNLLASGRILIAARHVVEPKGKITWEAVGTGPFRLKEYQAGVSHSLVKNNDYFIKGRPYLDGMRLYIIRDPATRLAAFRAGQSKMSGAPPEMGILRSQAEGFKKQIPGVVVKPFRRLASIGLLPNPMAKPWDDVRVRRAAFLAVDRQKGIEVLAEGAGELGVTQVWGEWLLPKDELLGMPGFRQAKDQDIAEAKRLLAEAGYPNGFRSKMLVRVGVAEYERAATFLQDQLGKIGIGLDLLPIEYSVWADRRRQLAYEVTVVNNHLDMFDPTPSARYITAKYGGQFSALDDPKLIELLQRQAQTANKEERMKLVWEVQRRVAEVVPHVVIGFLNGFVALWPEVRDFEPGIGLHNNFKYQDVWLAR